MIILYVSRSLLRALVGPEWDRSSWKATHGELAGVGGRSTGEEDTKV